MKIELAEFLNKRETYDQVVSSRLDKPIYLTTIMQEYADEQLILHIVSKRSELLIGLLEMLEKDGGNEFIDKAEIVAKYEANL